MNLAVCDTICQFNTGSANKAVILESFGIDAGTRTLSLAGLRKEDDRRIHEVERRVPIEKRKTRCKQS